MKKKLQTIRKQIDLIDSRILDLLDQRMRHVLAIGHEKSKKGAPVYSPSREKQIFSALEKRAAKSLLSETALKAIYREIMSAAIALEKPVQISYLGPEATYTHLASLSKFGASVTYTPAANFREVFRDVEQGLSDYGVIPIENSIDGAVTHALDLLIDSDLKICSEIYFGISHHLMSKSPIKKIKRVYSKSEVFSQCRLWLERNLHGIELIPTASSAAAAQKVKTEKGAAAIGSSLAAKLYGVPVLAKGIQDFSENVTRFLVISKNIAGQTGDDKTSILVSVKDKVGALHEMIAPFMKYRVNMSKIESRPSKKKAWEYYFFIDFEGHIQNARIQRLLAEVEKHARFIKILGSFPTAGYAAGVEAKGSRRPTSQTGRNKAAAR